MAASETEAYSLDSVVRGHHVYKSVWTPTVGEELCYLKNQIIHTIVGLFVLKKGYNCRSCATRAIQDCSTFYKERSCIISGHRKLGKGLEVPCRYNFVGKTKVVKKLEVLLDQKRSL